jgi:uncharacterized protein (TIGR03435 family)
MHKTRHVTLGATILGLAASVLVGASSLPSQLAPAFEVASIKRTPPNDSGFYLNTQGETFVARNVTVRLLLGQSYGGVFLPTEIIGGPAWLSTDRFEIVAKTGRPNANALSMVRTLLEDRFKLKSHQETRELRRM